MLAVAVQLPAAVLTTDRCSVTGPAPSPRELEPEPQASAGAASMSTAQVADPTDLILTTKPPFCSPDEPGEDRQETLRPPYKTLNHQKQPADQVAGPAGDDQRGDSATVRSTSQATASPRLQSATPATGGPVKPSATVAIHSHTDTTSQR
jgi:hypothetical protein